MSKQEETKSLNIYLGVALIVSGLRTSDRRMNYILQWVIHHGLVIVIGYCDDYRLCQLHLHYCSILILIILSLRGP